MRVNGHRIGLTRAGYPVCAQVIAAIFPDPDDPERVSAENNNAYVDDLESIVGMLVQHTSLTRRRIMDMIEFEPSSRKRARSPPPPPSEEEQVPLAAAPLVEDEDEEEEELSLFCTSPPPPSQKDDYEEEEEADYEEKEPEEGALHTRLTKALVALTKALRAVGPRDAAVRHNLLNAIGAHVDALRDQVPAHERRYGVSERMRHLGYAPSHAQEIGQRALELYRECFGGRDPDKRAADGGRFLMNVYAESACPRTLDTAIREFVH